MKGLLVVVSACLLTVVLVAGSLPARSHLGTTPYTMKFKLYACDGYRVPTLPWTLIGGGVQYADPAQNYYRKDVYYSVPHAGFNVSIFTTESNVSYIWGTPYYGYTAGADLHFCYTESLFWWGPVFTADSFTTAVTVGSKWVSDPENLVTWPCIEYDDVREYYALGQDYGEDTVTVIEDAASGRPFQIITCSTGEDTGCLLYQIALGDPTAFVPSIADYSVFLPPDTFGCGPRT
ncbi:hypothetical protein Pelo_9028 [Pelomyxa schiedti]|nr:hypothetical protein Pelo_9028 [Pelomyxa schiedti]